MDQFSSDEFRTVLDTKQVNMFGGSCPSPSSAFSLGSSDLKLDLSVKSAKLEANLGEQHHRERRRLEEKLVRARAEVTFAESALRRLRGDQDHFSDQDVHVHNGVRVKKDIDDELPKTPHRSSERNKNKIDKISYLMSGLQLPKVELGFFDGNPVNYLKFIKQFDYYVESKAVDSGQRMLQLMHYCRGRAREAIEDCILLPPDAAYARARRVLKELFGQPHVVARAHINDLLTLSKTASSSSEGLSRLAVRMQSTGIALEQLNYLSDLNAMHTLETIVKRLPPRLQMRWAEEVERISAFDCEPSFNDLTEFVARSSKVANSRFGQIAERSMFPHPSSHVDSRHSRDKVNIFAQHSTGPCRMCSDKHETKECSEFLKLDVPQRWSTAKRIGLCFNCLADTHTASKCRHRLSCGVKDCERRHHRLLHNGNEAPNKSISSCATLTQSRRAVRLGVVPVFVQTPAGIIKTLAFLDSGSDTSLVRKSFVEKHHVEGIPTRLTISTVNGHKDSDCLKVNLLIHSVDGFETIKVDGAYTVDDLPIKPLESVNAEARKWAHLQNIPFAELHGEVDILLGCDVSEVHWQQDQRLGAAKQPYAILTVLGWVLCGPLQGSSSNLFAINCACSSEELIQEQIKMLYNTEFADTSVENNTLSIDDQNALAIVSEGTRVVDGHFEIPLPRKTTKLPDNHVIARRRALLLKRRLCRDEDLLTKYTNQMQLHIEKGFIELAPANSEADAPVWYMPHHPVLNPKKPEKLRIVFDCASKFNGCSLNDTLFQGPDLTTSLIAVLLRFRVHPVAISADIEEMFLQVRVPERDRDSLRVLWWPNGDLSKDLSIYRMTVHPFGATSSPFCANFALRKCADRFGLESSDAVKKALERNFYVDDCLISLPDIKSAKCLIDELSALLRRGGFRLTKWTSNNREILRYLPEIERANCVKEFDTNCLPMTRTLGIKWDAEKDCFIFSFDLKDRPLTRRGLLSAVSGLYDPLGFVAPWLLPGKILLQQLCRKRLGWDEPLENEDEKQIRAWMRTLQCLDDMEIPRCITGSTDSVSTELHLFSDASEVGYGAVAYLCIVDENDIRQCQLIFSKARVAPIKSVSVPRLELSAAVLSVRVYCLLKDSGFVNFSNVFFWTDSSIVLYYINNVSSRFSTFVANRLTKIHDCSQVSQWRYVRSEDNPADRTSRGAHGFLFKDDWLLGPSFLHGSKDLWPPNVVPNCKVDDIEAKRKEAVINAVAGNETWRVIWEKYSDWWRLLRSFVWLTRFKKHVMMMYGRRKDYELPSGPLKICEVRQAESDIFRLVQNECFPSELTLLSSSTSSRNILKGNNLYQLKPILVDGILRVGGRLANRSAPFDSIHPIILPRRHAVTRLIIRHYHLCEGHVGLGHLLSSLRTKFWIPHGSAAVKEVIRNCMICRRQNARPGAQIMAPLPLGRVQTGCYPFSQTGLDYFGPFYVKQGRSLVKRYGCIFTCLQTRAVHIEIAHSLTTDSFIMALLRFIGRRGSPDDIYSDNGTNFTGAERELKGWLSGIDRNKIDRRMLPQGVQWHFTPPYASHRGGVWERVIKSIRKVLSCTFREQNTTDEGLITAMIEVERILNNRPISPALVDDPENIALTPNHLLLLRYNIEFNYNISFADSYRSKWKQAQYLASLFWRRWIREYLPTLQKRQRWNRQERNFKTGDVVIIVTDDVSRGNWPLGVIVGCHYDSDDNVRTVEVKTKNGVIKRDIRRLCLLEASAIDNEQSELRCPDAGSPQVGGGSSGLPHREGPPGASLRKGAVQ